MEYAIKLRLSGMMQGYSESRYIYKRKTLAAPTQRSVLGIIAAAEGILRSEKEELTALENALTIEIEAPTNKVLPRLTDFQTVRSVKHSRIARAAGVVRPDMYNNGISKVSNRELTSMGYILDDLFNTADGTGKEALPLMDKEYLLDGDFFVTVRGKEEDVLKAAEALRHPIFPLYLGRKCCQPNEPIFHKLVTLE